MKAPRTYEEIKALSKATGRKIPELLAMSATNDPVYIMPSQALQGRWFAELWERFELPDGVHLRRIHYKLVSQPEPLVMPGNGKPYENTDYCWQFLGNASKAARCLNMVSASAFVDARNPDPIFNREYSGIASPRLELFDTSWFLPEIQANLADELDDWLFPFIRVRGYEPNDRDHPFHLELITEKSTMDDVLVPLCLRFGINYMPMTGFASITGTINLLQRVKTSGKPGVVLYISDFDPAGSSMPKAVARQIEFWRPVYAPENDVVLNPAVLTLDQVKHYNLPPIPIKETDRRQNKFLEHYGVEGATELDALEALHPGELSKIIREAVAPYIDDDSHARVVQAGRSAEKEAQSVWGQWTDEHWDKWRALKSQVAEVVDAYRERLESLRQAMKTDLEPFHEELDSLRQEIKKEFGDLCLRHDLPARPESPLALPNHFGGMFDSRREYLNQLDFYHAAGTDMEVQV